MKLTTFTQGDRQHFGFVLEDKVISFAGHSGLVTEPAARLLEDMNSYLSDLDTAYPAAQRIAEQVSTGTVTLNPGIDCFRLEDVVLELPVTPRVFFDMLTSPTHVYLSAKTIFKYEMSPIVRAIVAPLMLRTFKRKSQDLTAPDVPEYYKGNTDSFCRSGDPLVWPAYTSFVDIEPELGFVVGNSSTNRVAGYLVINDCSARDVQTPDMSGSRLGPQRSKDFQNVMSPYLITPDELDPYSCEVSVNIGDRLHWQGRTDRYAMTAEQIIGFMEKTYPVSAGALFAMGTVPKCTCLDNDVWINPGETIRIEMEGIGAMENTFPNNPKIDVNQATRWGRRPELESCYVDEV